MGTVINLSHYRRKARKVFFAKYGSRIDRIVDSFLRMNLHCDFQQLAEDYQSGLDEHDLASWDYVQFREILLEAFDQVFGNALYEQLRAQIWFDSSLVTKDELIELCLTSYVLGRVNMIAKT